MKGEPRSRLGTKALTLGCRWRRRGGGVVCVSTDLSLSRQFRADEMAVTNAELQSKVFLEKTVRSGPLLSTAFFLSRISVWFRLCVFRTLFAFCDEIAKPSRCSWGQDETEIVIGPGHQVAERKVGSDGEGDGARGESAGGCRPVPR